MPNKNIILIMMKNWKKIGYRLNILKINEAFPNNFYLRIKFLNTLFMIDNLASVPINRIYIRLFRNSEDLTFIFNKHDQMDRTLLYLRMCRFCEFKNINTRNTLKMIANDIFTLKEFLEREE